MIPRLVSRLLIVAPALLIAATVAHAGTGGDGTVVRGELAAKMDAAVTRAAGNGFWGSVLVARGGTVVFAKGYGFADYGSRPNTPRTLFEIASVSKQITAAAILHLHEKKKLSVDHSIDRYFKGVPEEKKKILVRHLLTHSSGISKKAGVPYRSPIGRSDYIRKMMAEPLDFEPGSQFQYSNVGYALLAAIVEEITGGSFEKYVEKHLFKPAKMSDSGFVGDADLIGSKRVSRRKTSEPGDWTAADWHYGWGYRGMGGVVSTVYDLFRWDRALRGKRVLGEAAKKLLHTPFRSGYAFGWKVDVTGRGTRKAHHSGGVAGFTANVVRYLEDDALIVILSNNDGSVHGVTAAIEPLLFEPVPLGLAIDVSPFEVDDSRILRLAESESFTWKAARKGKGFAIRLCEGKHAIAEILFPETYARKVIVSLEQAIAARAGDDAGDPARVEPGFYLQRYPRSPKISLTEQLRLDIRPEYRGRDAGGQPVIDRRVTLVVIDGRNGIWPVMVKLNVAAARALLDALRDV